MRSMLIARSSVARHVPHRSRLHSVILKIDWVHRVPRSIQRIVNVQRRDEYELPLFGHKFYSSAPEFFALLSVHLPYYQQVSSVESE